MIRTIRRLAPWSAALAALAVLVALAVLAAPAAGDLGLLEEKPETKPPAVQPQRPPATQADSAKPPATSQPADAKPTASRAAGETDKSKIVRYTKPTTQEAQAALAEAREKALATVRRLRVNLRLVETPHFLIFTDWPAGEQKWTAVTFEQMYRGLARQFGIDPSENIWYGKLPVYAFNSSDDFVRFVKEIDQLPDDAARSAGYAYAQTDGRGHIVLRRYGGRNLLASTIVHEGTHAFLARYRSNRLIPSWLNEGLAQMMEQAGVPGSTKLRDARNSSVNVASRRVDIRRIFTDDDNIEAEMYPVAMTVTDLLIRRSRTAYVAMINDIKDGTEVDAALKKHYGWTYTDLARWWYRWAKMNFK